MSNFYGNILKHFQEAFSSLSFRNFGNKVEKDITINAENTKERLILSAGDQWLNFSGGTEKENGLDTIVTISHSNPDTEVRNDTGNLSVINPDLSSKEGTTEITLSTPAKDSKGHLNGTENFKHSINLNIDTEITERKQADATLQDNIDTEIAERKQADITLQDNIDTEASQREQTDTTLQNNIDTEAIQREQADTNHNNRILKLEERIKDLSGAMHFKGIEEKIPEGEALKTYIDGDVIIVGNKEYVFETEKGFVELGDTSEETKRIKSLEDRATTGEERLEIIQGNSSTNGSILKALEDAKKYTDELRNGQVQTNTNNIATINSPTEGILKKSKDYTDQLENGQVQSNTDAISAINDNVTGIYAVTIKEAKEYTDQLKNNEVKNNTEAIIAINDPKTGILEQANTYARSLKFKNVDLAKDISFNHQLTLEQSTPERPMLKDTYVLKLSFMDVRPPQNKSNQKGK